jgi:hypothetical protein
LRPAHIFEPDPPAVAMVAIERAIASRVFHVPTEKALQDAVGQVLQEEAIAFEREVKLGPGERIDFLTAGGVGLELKIEGATSAIARQLERYARSPEVQALMLVTTRAVHVAVFARLPQVGGRPLRTIRVRGPLL